MKMADRGDGGWIWTARQVEQQSFNASFVETFDDALCLSYPVTATLWGMNVKSCSTRWLSLLRD